MQYPRHLRHPRSFCYLKITELSLLSQPTYSTQSAQFTTFAAAQIFKKLPPFTPNTSSLLVNSLYAQFYQSLHFEQYEHSAMSDKPTALLQSSLYVLPSPSSPLTFSSSTVLGAIFVVFAILDNRPSMSYDIFAANLQIEGFASTLHLHCLFHPQRLHKRKNIVIRISNSKSLQFLLHSCIIGFSHSCSVKVWSSQIFGLSHFWAKVHLCPTDLSLLRSQASPFLQSKNLYLSSSRTTNIWLRLSCQAFKIMSFLKTYSANPYAVAQPWSHAYVYSATHTVKH